VGRAAGRLIPVKKRTKWGYVDLAGKPVTEFKYDLAWEVRNGHARVKAGDLFGLIDSTGREVLPPGFTALTDVQHGLLVATRDGLSGAVEPSGRVRIPLAYTAVELLDARTAKVVRNDRLAYIRLADGAFIWKEEGFDADAAPSTE
jgi:hypothetical protein